MQVLTFTLNGIDYGIPISDVESIETSARIIPIPEAPAHIKGIVRLHGNIIPVYSLASRFAYADKNIDNIVVANMDGMKIGLEVAKVKEIMEVGNRDVIPMPQIMNATQNCFNNVVSCNKALIVVLSVQNLFSSEERKKIQELIEEAKEK